MISYDVKLNNIGEATIKQLYKTQALLSTNVPQFVKKYIHEML